METLILLARPPRPGRVKTRLIPALGGGGAARLYEAFLADAAARAAALRRERVSVGLSAEWALDGEVLESLPLARWLPGPFLHHPQSGNDLGARMAAALGRRLAHGGRAVLIGTDFPDLPPEILVKAFSALEEIESGPGGVLGPARDGGYYLIGLSRLEPGIFSEIGWGDPGVFETQRENLESLGYRVSILPEWGDVDTPEDLEGLKARLAENPTAAPATRAALALSSSV